MGDATALGAFFYIIGGLVGAVVGYFILYFIIKVAVRNGTIEAHQRLNRLRNPISIQNDKQEHSLEAKNVIVYADGTWDCPQCGKLNKEGEISCFYCDFSA
jgi:hypothetical protein